MNWSGVAKPLLLYVCNWTSIRGTYTASDNAPVQKEGMLQSEVSNAQHLVALVSSIHPVTLDFNTLIFCLLSNAPTTRLSPSWFSWRPN